MEKYDDNFIENATVAELDAASRDVYQKMWKQEFGSPKYQELSNLHSKIVNKKFELCRNRNPNYRWTDKNRWE